MGVFFSFFMYVHSDEVLVDGDDDDNDADGRDSWARKRTWAVSKT